MLLGSLVSWCYPDILLLHIYLKEYKAWLRNTCMSMFIAAVVTISKIWNQPRSPSIDKEDGIHVHREVLYRHSEEGHYVAYSKIDATGNHYIEQRKQNEKIQILHVFSHLWIVDFILMHKITYKYMATKQKGDWG